MQGPSRLTAEYPGGDPAVAGDNDSEQYWPPMAANPEILKRAADVIRSADGLVITAGAGMGVDSGLPDFRSREGFWRAYPPFAKLGLTFEELANPQWFERDPVLAWGFYGHRFELYRHTTPHEGFAILRRWAEAKSHGCAVFTSNVDGHFQKAGFAEECMVECHGSLQHFQCVRPCCSATWPAPTEVHFEINPTTLRTTGELPCCVRCGGLARPNVLMFGDETWCPARTSAQWVRFRAWLRSLARGKYAVIELGAGMAVPTVRRTSEQLAAAGRVPLIRINPGDVHGPPGVLALTEKAQTVLRQLAAMLA